MLTFSKKYLGYSMLLLLTEIGIAMMHDTFFRPYAGDYLVVMLLYCFTKSFIKAGALPVALFVLLLSFAVEIGQHFSLIARLGLSNSTAAKLLLGNSFSVADLLAYVLGISTVLVIEFYSKSKKDAILR